MNSHSSSYHRAFNFHEFFFSRDDEPCNHDDKRAREKERERERVIININFSFVRYCEAIKSF